MRKLRYPIVLICFAAMFSVACTTWEHTTYATLNASKAVIDQSSADYNAGKIPQTKKVHDLIQTARDAQTTAVKAFEAYAVAKVGGATPEALATFRQAVVDATASVVKLVGDLKALKGGS
jgi:hypothetical protein